METLTTLAQTVDEKTEALIKELRMLKHGTLALVVVVFAVIGVLSGYYISSDTFLGPFKKVSYAMTSPSTIELALETRSPMRTRIEYGTSTDYVNQKQVSPSYSMVHEVSLDGLLPGKAHMVRFVAEDQSGKLHVSEFYKVK